MNIADSMAALFGRLAASGVTIFDETALHFSRNGKIFIRVNGRRFGAWDIAKACFD